MKIYLAGKITRSGWRESILEPGTMDSARDHVVMKRWPVMQRAVFGGHDYVGPYFIPNLGYNHDPGFHGPDDHGLDASGGRREMSGYFDDDHTPAGYTREEVTKFCLGAIDRAEIVFAWIDRIDVYGTIAELGYAKAQNKVIWIASPERYRDLWFIYEMATRTALYQQQSADKALSTLLEEHRREQLRSQIDGYVYLLKSGPAYKIGRARQVDARIKQISPVLPYPVEIVHTIPSNNVVRAEAHFHKMFASKRLNGEWFDLSDQDVFALRRLQEAIFDDQASTSTALVRTR